MAKKNQTAANAAPAQPPDPEPQFVTSSGATGNGASSADLAAQQAPAPDTETAPQPDLQQPEQPAPETVAPEPAAPAQPPEQAPPQDQQPDLGRPVPGELSDAGNSDIEPTGAAADSQATDPPAPPAPQPAAPAVPQIGPGRWRVTCQPPTPIAHHFVEVDADDSAHAWKQWLDLNGVSGTSTPALIERLGEKAGSKPVKAPTVKHGVPPAEPVVFSDVI